MEDLNYENELRSLRSLVLRLAREIDYKNHLLMEKEEKIADLHESLVNEKKSLNEKSASVSVLLSENAEKAKLLSGLIAEKKRLFHETSTVKNTLNQKERKLDEISGAISLLIAQNNKKDILIDEKERLLRETSESLNMLKVENEKLLDEKDAGIRTLTIQNVEKEKLIDSISANMSHLMTEKDRFLEAYVKGSSKIEKMKQEIEKLQLDLESKKSQLEQNKMMQETETTEPPKIESNLQLKEQNCALVISEQAKIQDLEEWRDEVNVLRKEVEEKTEALQNSEMDNRTLMIKELRNNHELQAARRAAIEGFEAMLQRKRVNIGIKRIGEVDQKAFREVCSNRFYSGNWDEEFGDWEEKSMELCSLWQNKISDPGWQPFKHQDINGKLTEVIDENDGTMNELRDEWGEEVYEAVAEALLGVNEYNASGRYPVSELWNFKENKTATLGEVIQYVIKQWRIHKNKKVTYFT